MPLSPLVDSFGRIHDNLRISVTDRCNIRCFYCMPETGVQFVKRSEILDFEEIERFVRIAVGLGIRKLRVTGGEPLPASPNVPEGPLTLVKNADGSVTLKWSVPKAGGAAVTPRRSKRCVGGTPRSPTPAGARCHGRGSTAAAEQRCSSSSPTRRKQRMRERRCRST